MPEAHSTFQKRESQPTKDDPVDLNNFVIAPGGVSIYVFLFHSERSVVECALCSILEELIGG